MSSIVSECYRLIEDESPIALSQIYLYALYSLDEPEFLSLKEAASLPQVSAFLETFDIELLHHEREARFRNLKKRIVRACPLIEGFKVKNWEESLKNFTRNREFWENRGRTLSENFALFAAEDNTIPEIDREVIKVAGIISGLGALEFKSCPWKSVRQLIGADVFIRGAKVSEDFDSVITIKDFGSQDNSVSIIEGLSRIVVSRLNNGAVVPICLEA